jgi:hypothetical protein
MLMYQSGITACSFPKGKAPPGNCRSGLKRSTQDGYLNTRYRCEIPRTEQPNIHKGSYLKPMPKKPAGKTFLINLLILAHNAGFDQGQFQPNLCPSCHPLIGLLVERSPGRGRRLAATFQGKCALQYRTFGANAILPQSKPGRW